MKLFSGKWTMNHYNLKKNAVGASMCQELLAKFRIRDCVFKHEKYSGRPRKLETG